GIAHGGAPSALERLRGKLSELVCERLEFGRQTLWFLKTFPHLLSPSSPRVQGLRISARCYEFEISNLKFEISLSGSRRYFEYNSTMSCSVIGGVVTFSRFGN